MEKIIRAFKNLIGIALVLLLIGLLWNYIKYGDSAGKSSTKKIEEDEKEESNSKSNEDRLKLVSSRIELLLKEKERFLRKEKWSFFTARFLIALLLVGLNVWYLSPFEDLKDNILKLPKFNGLILLGYSFFAFILYGKPDALVAAIKKAARNILKTNDELLMAHLEMYRKEEKKLGVLLELERLNLPQQEKEILSVKIKAEELLN